MGSKGRGRVGVAAPARRTGSAHALHRRCPCTTHHRALAARAAHAPAAAGDRLLCAYLLRGAGLPRREGAQPAGRVHAAHRGHATPRCGDTMHARSPGILPAVGPLHGLLLHPHLQVRLPRAHGDAPHQGTPHTPHRTHHPTQQFACTCNVERHTHRRACMRRAAAAPARATHPRNAPRDALQRHLQRAAAIHPRALCDADQVCAPATIGAARGILRRRRPAHGERRVQCVRWVLRSCLLESFNGLVHLRL